MSRAVCRYLEGTTLIVALLAGTPGVAQAGHLEALGEILGNIILGGPGQGPYDPYPYPPREYQREGGPAFCRTGEGHPVFGPQWCLEKGFGLRYGYRGFDTLLSSRFDEFDHEAWKREEERRHEGWKRLAEEEREARKYHREVEREARKQRHEAWERFAEDRREAQKDHLEREREVQKDRREWLKERAEIDREAARRDLEAYERF